MAESEASTAGNRMARGTLPTTIRHAPAEVKVPPKDSSLADPTRLKPVKHADQSGNISVQVIVETPRGCRNKFAFDRSRGGYMLRRVLPAGMTFPYDFGFIPGTEAEDGDPIDVLLLMDEPAFPGIAVQARLIGVLEGEQTEEGRTIRNDRLLAVAEANHSYANVREAKNLPAQLIRELGEFFVNYSRLEGRAYRFLGCKGTQEALRLLKKARRVA